MNRVISFEIWKEFVDKVVFVTIGYHLSDLPDEDFRVKYDSGVHFCDMAKIVIVNFHNETF